MRSKSYFILNNLFSFMLQIMHPLSAASFHCLQFGFCLVALKEVEFLIIFSFLVVPIFFFQAENT